MKRIALISVGIVISFLCSTLRAQVPQLMNYQGRVVVGSTNFDGSGQFKFALVNAAGTTAFWTNDGTHLDGTEPNSAVTLTVSKGLYSLLLGDTSLTNMTALPANVFNNSDVRLRVWFNDGTHGSQRLTPDQRIASVGYAIIAGNVPDSAITSAKIASGAIGSTQLASGAVTGTNIAQGAIGSPQLAANLTLAGTTTGSFSGNGAGLTNVTAHFPWQTVAGTSQLAQPNTGYLLTNSAQVIVTLPSSPNPGDVVRVSSIGAGGWRIAQNAGQSVSLPSNLRGIWTPHENTRNWSAVASSSDGSKLVAVVFNGQIYTSTDSGVTWTARESTRNWLPVASSANGSKLVAAVQGGQIYTSTDSGVTWTPRESARFWEAVASSADGSKLVAAVDGGQIYTSADSGVTWTPRDSDHNWTAVASSADGSKLVGLVRGSDGQVFTSTDSGVTWAPRGLNLNWKSVASSSDGSKLVAAAIPDQIYTSVDSGVTWTPRESFRTWQSVASSSDGSKLAAVALGGQIYTSTDSGVTWTSRETNRQWGSIASSADGSKLVALVNGGQIYTATVSGTTASGIAGYLLGDPNSAVELQYIGNGQFVPLTHEGSILPF